ncbi:MAG TPA: hydantoinase/oxoprolinase family protein [bacterium]|nr:hydantoinase/oxoprolinase family protein [bacterium]
MTAGESGGARLRIGVDIGGTFTDLILLDDAGGVFQIGKVLTTTADPADGVIDGVRGLLEAAGVPAAAVAQLVHGTTLLTNALIERKGARTALITTRGFRDALEIAREHRYDMYDLFIERPAPLVPRYLRYELRERVLEDGTVEEALDLEEARRLVETLRRDEVQAVAVCFLHSYRAPAHERAVGDLIRTGAPRLACALSHEVVPEIREYERTSTTVANVYIQDLAARYLARLEERLRAMDVRAPLFVMQSTGGICSVETASRLPIRVVESGPAAGALGAAYFGKLAGRPDLLSFDMGGTTAKACLVEGGEPLTAPEFEVARVYRFKRGSGLPIKVPAIEMIEIGAGGGSLARVNRLGLLTVGPDSAGADPGPACYGRGGREPTVTDADLVLGYLDPEFFLGGRLRLDREAARRTIEERVAGPLGLDTVQAAWGIHQVVNENMASAVRVHAVERGKDIRRFPLFAFGGAGPVHAHRVARILRCATIVCPLGAGVASAMGFLVAPLVFDFVRTVRGGLEAMDWAAAAAAVGEMEEEGRRLLSATVRGDEIGFRRWADMRYRGQGYEVRVPLPDAPLEPGGAAALRDAFERAYAAIYGHTAPGVPVDVVGWRVAAYGPKPVLPSYGAGAPTAGRSPGGSGALKTRRAIYLPEHRGFADAPVYDRYRLVPGDEFAGPAVVEERESTVVVGPDARVRMDGWLNLVIEDAGRPAAS